MINKKIITISITSLLLSLSACGGGSGANTGTSNQPNPQPSTTKTVFVPATSQIRTLSSYNTDFGNNVQSMQQAKSLKLTDTPKNPCFAVKPIAGQNLATGFSQWGGVSISFDVTNKCSTAQPINNMSVVVSGVTMNDSITLLSGGQVLAPSDNVLYFC